VSTSQEVSVSKDPKLSVGLTTAANEYKATWGKSGGVDYPKIPLTITLSNESKGAWLCPQGSFTLEVSAERSKTQEKKTFPLQKKDCRIEVQETITETTEVGEFLSSVAAQYMKGDVLTVRALVNFQTTQGFSAVNVWSPPIKLSIFIPEG
jgi:hypothetical protein